MKIMQPHPAEEQSLDLKQSWFRQELHWAGGAWEIVAAMMASTKRIDFIEYLHSI